LKYHGAEAIEIPESVVIGGEVSFEKSEAGVSAAKQMAKRAEKPWSAVITGLILLLLIKTIITVVVALFGVMAYPKRSQELVDHSVKHFGWELLRGFLVFILAPVVILVLLISMVGVMFGALAGLLYGLMYITAMVYAGVVLGALIFKLFTRSKHFTVTWQSALVGVIAINLLKLIPIVGLLICGVFMLVALGALANIGYHYFWVKRAK
jgi:TM2 domain-containing membrane protein YozV